MKNTVGLMALLLSSVAYGHGDMADSGQVFKEVPVTNDIVMLQGKGGNIGLLQGEDGVLLIDDDYKENIGALEKALDKKSAKPRFIINTHWHGDHTGGNEHLGEYASIVAHDNVRSRMASDQKIKFFGMNVPASPKAALPLITFEQSMTLHFNGQTLDVVHYPNGHTDGDSIVIIQPANVVHMGDHFFSGFFPFVDLESGGSVQGMTKNIEAVITKMNKDTKVIPGHGPLSTLKDVKTYHKMLVKTTAIVKRAMDKGKSLEDIKKKGLPSKWKSWGNGFIKEGVWITLVYTSLKG